METFQVRGARERIAGIPEREQWDEKRFRKKRGLNIHKSVVGIQGHHESNFTQNLGKTLFGNQISNSLSNLFKAKYVLKVHGINKATTPSKSLRVLIQ